MCRQAKVVSDYRVKSHAARRSIEYAVLVLREPSLTGVKAYDLRD